ncbi:MAG: hypothetical protein AB7G93_08270 [Bdellovibrionales bacterium]
MPISVSALFISSDSSAHSWVTTCTLTLKSVGLEDQWACERHNGDDEWLSCMVDAVPAGLSSPQGLCDEHSSSSSGSYWSRRAQASEEWGKKFSGTSTACTCELREGHERAYTLRRVVGSTPLELFSYQRLLLGRANAHLGWEAMGYQTQDNAYQWCRSKGYNVHGCTVVY